MASIIRNEGRAVPNAVATAPRTLFNLYPTKILILMANTPGQLWAMAIKSSISLRSIQRWRFTTSSSINGIMAYPPPRVNMPILKKVLNDSQNMLLTFLYSLLTFHFCFSTHLRALTKASIHGVTSSIRRSAGYQAFCQGNTARSK